MQACIVADGSILYARCHLAGKSPTQLYCGGLFHNTSACTWRLTCKELTIAASADKRSRVCAYFSRAQPKAKVDEAKRCLACVAAKADVRVIAKRAFSAGAKVVAKYTSTGPSRNGFSLSHSLNNKENTFLCNHVICSREVEANGICVSLIMSRLLLPRLNRCFGVAELDPSSTASLHSPTIAYGYR